MQRFFTIASTSLLAAIALVVRANSMVPVNASMVPTQPSPPSLSAIASQQPGLWANSGQSISHRATAAR